MQRALLAALHSEQDVLQKRLERFEQVCSHFPHVCVRQLMDSSHWSTRTFDLRQPASRILQEEQEWLQLLKEMEDPVSGACAEPIPAAAELDDAGAEGSGAAQGVAGAEPGGLTVLSDLSGMHGTWLKTTIHSTLYMPRSRHMLAKTIQKLSRLWEHLWKHSNLQELIWLQVLTRQ